MGDKNIKNVELLLDLLNKFENSTITIEYNCENKNIGGVKFDREITESIREVLTECLRERNRA